MTNYRRNRVQDGTCFFTVTTAERHHDLLVRQIEVLKSVLRDEQQHAPIVNLGLAVLPDHLHAVWKLPEGDVDYSNRWRRIKGSFSRALPRGERISASRTSKGDEVYGNGASGSIRFRTKTTCGVISNICILTQ